MSEPKEFKSKFKELEILFCYAEFYSNGKNLAVPTNREEAKFNKVQEQIYNLKKQVID